GDRNELAPVDFQMNARQRVGLHFVGEKNLGDAFQSKQRLVKSFHSFSPICSVVTKAMAETKTLVSESRRQKVSAEKRIENRKSEIANGIPCGSLRQY